jgi:hypothetical protein
VQVAFAQLVPDGVYQHAPLPLQNPSRPHATPSEHSLPGSVPFEMKPQVPSAPRPVCAARHDEQVPLHRLLQQTPSTQ